MTKSISITCNGMFFSSLVEMATYFKVHPSTVGRRLRDGWSTEEAVGFKKRKRLGHGNQVIVDGKSFKTIKEACQFHGLNAGTIAAIL